MEILLCLGGILYSASATAFNETSSPLEIREFAAESPSNEGIVNASAPLENITVRPIEAEESREEVAAAEQPLEITFPKNHKNSTKDVLLSEKIHFPYYNHLNNYQQQYKAYVEQKQLFNRNPIKFEEDSKEKLIWNGVDVPKDVQGGSHIREKRKKKLQKKPFPYVFEHNKVQDWYESAAANVAEEEPKNEFRVDSHKGAEQFIFSRDYPHDQKLYETESVTHFRETVKKGKESPWKKVFHLLTALVPLGLVLAALTPNVISVNSTAVTKSTRQRAEDSFPMQFKELEVIELMNGFGVESLAEAQCEDRFICELGRRGSSSAAGLIEKRFWFLANETPWEDGEKAGMNDLFKAIKTGNCDTYKCYSAPKTTHNNGIGKKLIRTKKKRQE